MLMVLLSFRTPGDWSRRPLAAEFLALLALPTRSATHAMFTSSFHYLTGSSKAGNCICKPVHPWVTSTILTMTLVLIHLHVFRITRIDARHGREHFGNGRITDGSDLDFENYWAMHEMDGAYYERPNIVSCFMCCQTNTLSKQTREPRYYSRW